MDSTDTQIYIKLEDGYHKATIGYFDAETEMGEVTSIEGKGTYRARRNRPPALSPIMPFRMFFVLENGEYRPATVQNLKDQLSHASRILYPELAQ